MNLKATGPNGKGLQRINIHLLKPFRFRVDGWPTDLDSDSEVSQVELESEPQWIMYPPRIKRPLLQHLPYKVATFIVENLSDQLKLGNPPPLDARQRFYEDDRKRRWSMHALNEVLSDVLVPATDGTQLAAYGCLEWESDLFRGTMRMHVRVLDKFHGKHRQVAKYFIIRNNSYFSKLFSYLFVVIRTF